MLHIKRMVCSDFYLYSYIKIGRLIVDARQRPRRPKKKEREETFWMAQESSARSPPDLITLLLLPLSLSLPRGVRQGQPTLILSPPASNITEAEALGGFGQGVDATVSLQPHPCVCVYIAKRYTSARVMDLLVHHPDQQTDHRLNQPTHATEHRAPARDGGRAGPRDLISHDRLRQLAPRVTEDARTRAPRTTSIGSARQERADVPRSELINLARPT
jgi:hypothetical protein